jgi:hypothetical protein
MVLTFTTYTRSGIFRTLGCSRSLDVPAFYDGEEPPKIPKLPKRKTTNDILWGSKGKDARLLGQFCRLFSRMEASDLGLVRFMAQKMARRKVG